MHRNAWLVISWLVLGPGVNARADGNQDRIVPTVTKSVAFVTPKRAKAWGEMNLACLRAMAAIAPGATSLQSMFDQSLPRLTPAIKAAGIDIDQDLQAAGAFECGSEACMYVALTLREPQKLVDELRTLTSDTPIQSLTPTHHTLEMSGPQGPRTLHIRIVPIEWRTRVPDDPFSREAARATHVVLVDGVNGRNAADNDPLSQLASGASAVARMKEVEGVLVDSRGRCLHGALAGFEIKPGFKLERSRFVLAVPPAVDDPLMKLMGSSRTLDAEVELVLSPPPKPRELAAWIDDAKASLGEVATPLKVQFAGSPAIDMLLDVLSLVGERGFRSRLDGNTVKLSWRTDRIAARDIESIEQKMQAVMAHPPGQ